MDFEHDVSVNEYGFYCVPRAYAGRDIARVLARGEVYEPSTLRLMARKAGTGDIVTGGAFIGDFLPALAGALAPGACVTSFEPNPLSFAAAQRTIALNGLSNVEISPVAVADEAGRLQLEVVRPGGSTSAARARIVEAGTARESVAVDVVRLDDLCPPERAVSILHLDVEGYEHPALLGARDLIRRNAPMIVLEAARPRRRARHAAFLARHFPDLGYCLCGAMERNAFYLAMG